jgi:hypothetical protein
VPKVYFIKLDDVCDFSKNPSPSVLGLPKFWKSMPKYFEQPVNVLDSRQKMTIRHCPAVNDSANFGYTVYLPFDIFIDATNESQIDSYLPEINVSFFGEQGNINLASHQHPISFQNYVDLDVYHPMSIKINTLWGIKTDPGYSVWITSPFINTKSPFKVVDAIVDTDRFISCYPYQTLIKKGFCGTIKEGTPFLQVIPFKREEFSSVVLEKEFKEIKKQNRKIHAGFKNSYKRFFWSRKRFT